MTTGPGAPPLPVAILAGGLGTRLGLVTRELPKALVEVAGEPFVLHQLRLLARSGVRQVVLCVAHLGSAIRGALGPAPVTGLDVAWSDEGPRLLGTAGALVVALPLLGPAFGVLYGDAYLELDYRAVFDAFRRSRKPALMVVYRNENRWDTSNTIYEDGRILAYDKGRREARMRHIDYGFGVLDAGVVRALAPGQPADLAHVYRDLAARGELAGFEAERRFYEIGSPAGLEETRAYLARRTDA